MVATCDLLGLFRDGRLRLQKGRVTMSKKDFVTSLLVEMPEEARQEVLQNAEAAYKALVEGFQDNDPHCFSALMALHNMAMKTGGVFANGSALCTASPVFDEECLIILTDVGKKPVGCRAGTEGTQELFKEAEEAIIPAISIALLETLISSLKVEVFQDGGASEVPPPEAPIPPPSFSESPFPSPVPPPHSPGPMPGPVVVPEGSSDSG